MPPVLFRWLGCAGFELQVQDAVLAVDPFFSRPPFWRLWFGRLHSDPALSARLLPRCDAILVTHAHYDHLMDVPDIARRCGARVFGSPNACRLLEICGVPAGQVQRVQAGDTLRLGEFQVQVLPAEHLAVPGFSAGPLAPRLQPPLRLRQYRLDECFSFYIQAGGLRLLDWCSVLPAPAQPAEVLLTGVIAFGPHLRALVEATRPRVILPNHWDDLFRPLARPIRPALRPPRLSFPPFQSMDPYRLKEEIEQAIPGIRVFVPQVLQSCDLGQLLQGE